MAKKATRRASEVKGKSVTWYISTLNSPHAALVQQLDKLITIAAPQATSQIKWGQPVYEDNGPFCFLKASKNHVTLGFFKGVAIDDPKNLFEGVGKDMRHIKIKTAADVLPAVFRKMIKQAVALNHNANGQHIG